MKTYSWSDNIKCAVIKNEKEYEIMFNSEKVEPGEKKIFYPEMNREGLVSLDCDDENS